MLESNPSLYEGVYGRPYLRQYARGRMKRVKRLFLNQVAWVIKKHGLTDVDRAKKLCFNELARLVEEK